jgi:hypothetical protein
VVVIVLLLLLVFGVLGFIFATTKPLYEVKVREIQNVLASEQELILDIDVEATNPNIIAIGINNIDVDLFAKSKHMSQDEGGSGQQLSKLHPIQSDVDQQIPRPRRRRYPGGRRLADQGIVSRSGDAHVSEGESRTMLLGHLVRFTSGLTFEGSPVKHRSHSSSGELRLRHPGNKTEAGGSERWERVVQHPFELIVRGVLKYQLPLTTHQLTAAIGGSVLVHPEEGVDEEGNMRVESIWPSSPDVTFALEEA